MEYRRPTTVVYIATSIDGFISREDGSFDWLSFAEDPAAFQRFESFLQTIDAIVMGRNTFLQVIQFDYWPYHQIPVYVMSSSLKQLPDTAPVTCALRNNTPEQILAELEARNCKRVYVDGGITIAKFLEKDLIDELTITRVPILIGSGRTLFGPIPADIRYQHLSTEVWGPGTVQTKYLRIRN